MAHRFVQWMRGHQPGPRIASENLNYLPHDLEDEGEDDESNFDEVDGWDKSFFQRGREYESAYVNHRYTDKELKILNSHQTLDYLPPDSVVYRKWLKSRPLGMEWDRWLVMGLIGVLVGALGSLLHQVIDIIGNTKWRLAQDFIRHDVFLTWVWVFGFSLIFLLLSTIMVVYIRPSAESSGMPELIGFLNGTLIRHIFNLKTLVVKFLSCAFAVASGMPVGPEGPMIHMGALIGAGVSQFKSVTLGIDMAVFERFRNSQDRRNFISAGAAAGIASAFGAPVGGLLFAMEEVSSYWDMRLSWQTFFCCMVSAFTTDLLDSAFHAFHYEGGFGHFKTDRYILFNIESGIDMNILAIIPCVILGVIGGGLGAGFTFFNLKIVRFRRYVHSKLSTETKVNLVKMAEPILILFITCTITVLLPNAYRCIPFTCVVPSGDKYPNLCSNLTDDTGDVTLETSVEFYNCPIHEYDIGNGSMYWNGSYNQAATLMFVTGENTIHHLFSRNTHLQFDYFPLFIMLIFYYFLACWSAGTAISSGLVVPMLLIGGLYGRMIGKLMVDIFGVPQEEFWEWIDPGAMALLGAVSFFGGVTRLTMSLTVIMVEMTNDIQFLLLIMITVLFAKWIGDFITHPFYHALLELKCIPYLEQDPVVLNRDGTRLNLELYQSSHVMRHPVRTIFQVEHVRKLAQLLLDTNHGGFPVIQKETNTYSGLITRSELIVLLMQYHDQMVNPPSETPSCPHIYVPSVPFPDISARMTRKIRRSDVMEFKLRAIVSHTLDAKSVIISPPEHGNSSVAGSGSSSSLSSSPSSPSSPSSSSTYPNEGLIASGPPSDLGLNQSHFMDLSDYVNTSGVSVPRDFSLQRTYIIFRSLGLRHLVVVNEKNAVEGIITRKDLMGFALEDRLVPIPEEMVGERKA
ncbi:chloride channel protein C-like [Tigriopus californicus]|uniref:chloride channel protein C-like n=1 Tax=Tigriopus californicus TaxID=6832 RepID=UPI0027D9FA3C|nr:chloride channel protein C-like [Tigriopus californicus]